MSRPEELKSRTKGSILISGGSIAGPVTAWWLTRYGFKTTIVERWPELRKGGQNIDVRDAGCQLSILDVIFADEQRRVAKMMNLEPAILAANTTEQGMDFIDSQGRSLATFPATANGPTAECEILRGDLARVLYDETKDDTTWIFGDSIAEINDRTLEGGLESDDEDEPVEVTFHSGKIQRYSAVVLADGIASRTRKMVFGDEVHFKPLAMHGAYLTIPRIESDTRWAKWYIATGRRALLVRPDNYDTTRVFMSFMENPKSLEETQLSSRQSNRSAQIDLLKRKFAGAGWQTDRILAALDNVSDDEFYYERLGQIKAPHYSKGRVVLVGDAASCASPMSGSGTIISFTGAYILAGEMAKQSRLEHAFASYQTKMEPFVKKLQELGPGAPGIMMPETWWGVKLLTTIIGTVAWILSFEAVMAFGQKFSSGEAIDLPDYSEYRVDVGEGTGAR